ncbi:MAG: hypothetical protein SPG62_06530 [Lactobacillus johnsonii]|uniref:Uncharacterized protein n=1 Tax=Lactobacillus johnsonii TaxID=33959 RepID=A0A267M6D6_LACJH|nr:hypothetical protein [Lactobacillus johnsonii]MDY2640413.1 hypothetical protein [Ligilactobacillus salivarius]MCI7714614.1 hypothetical protein [Lactobacillus johnsonii]MCL5444335.1 hypothetical protein [Lactobacillus johnsonii]MDY5351858.1 hypothetical protein [Lactobacillus johnsonii]PAB55169.1 hypothetical protein A3Q24_05655 [Lactobacillus johnsonii]
MLLHGMEVNQDNLNDWGSGTLEKIRKDLEEKITKQQGNISEYLKLYTLIDYQIAFNYFNDLTYNAANQLREEMENE